MLREALQDEGSLMPITAISQRQEGLRASQNPRWPTETMWAANAIWQPALRLLRAA